MDWVRLHPQSAVTVPTGWSLDQVINRMPAEPGVQDIYVVADEGHVPGVVRLRAVSAAFRAGGGEEE